MTAVAMRSRSTFALVSPYELLLTATASATAAIKATLKIKQYGLNLNTFVTLVTDWTYSVSGGDRPVCKLLLSTLTATAIASV